LAGRNLSYPKSHIFTSTISATDFLIGDQPKKTEG